jgi:RNA polymerase sigma-70 factor (ECF subfamily)
MQQEVFVRLVDSHYEGLYRFALSLARSAADAADLTQQTFYIWATKGNTLRDPAKAKTWLFTTLYREFLRGRKRDSRVSSIEDLPPAEQDPPDLSADQVRTLDAEVVMDALHGVDEIFRAPLTLFYLKDLSYQEIAEVLGVPIGTVMSRLSRGKARLRAALSERTGDSKLIEFPRAQCQ